MQFGKTKLFAKQSYFLHKVIFSTDCFGTEVIFRTTSSQQRVKQTKTDKTDKTESTEIAESTEKLERLLE